MSSAARPFHIGCFTVADGRLIAVDDRAPVVAEVDLDSGATLQTRIWAVPPWTGRVVASDVAALGGSIAIASPAAGGVVFFDDDAIDGEVMPFGVPIRELVVDGDALWAIAETDEWGGADPALGWRPQRVIEPTADEIAAYKARAARWLEASVRDEGWRFVLAERSDERPEEYEPPNAEPDRSFAVRVPTPVWRIDGRVARRVDLGAVVSLHPVGGALVVVCERSDDPIVTHVHPEYGSGIFEYTVSILVGTPESGFEVLRSASELRHVIGVDGRRVWFDASDSDDFERTSRLVGIGLEGRDTAVEMALDDIWAVIDDRVVGKKDRDVVVATLDGRDAVRLAPPEFNHWESRVVDGGIYAKTEDDGGVVGLHVAKGAVVSVRVDVDCTPYDAAESDTTGSPITLPVMLDRGDIECCQPHATVGEPWSAQLFLDQGPQPWWADHSPEPVPDEVRNFGVVELDGQVLRAPGRPEEAALVSVGGVRLGVVGASPHQDRFRGVVHHEVHGGIEGVLATEVDAIGVVRRIQGVSYRYPEGPIDDEDDAGPIAQNPPVELMSTSDDWECDTYLLTIEFGADSAPD